LRPSSFFTRILCIFQKYRFLIHADTLEYEIAGKNKKYETEHPYVVSIVNIERIEETDSSKSFTSPVRHDGMGAGFTLRTSLLVVSIWSANSCWRRYLRWSIFLGFDSRMSLVVKKGIQGLRLTPPRQIPTTLTMA
jgi:hypothetical protein